jgi:uncharacterized protein YndB with AHSA1/START domain
LNAIRAIDVEEKAVEIIVRRNFAAPAEAVWCIVGDFAGCARWCLVGSCTVEGEGIGAVRTVTGAGGGIADELKLKQTLTAFDPQMRSLAYEMNDSDGLPWTDYRSRISVTEIAEGCEVTWTCHVNPSADHEAVERGVKHTYRIALDNLSRLIEAA